MKITKSEDGTELIGFPDGRKTVLIPTINDKLTVCISSQIGCGMKCAFCRAGEFVRNISSDEIVSQVSVATANSGKKVTSIVVMGMGESMLNFDAVDSALRKIHSMFDISFKHITLSTCGLHLDKLKDVPYQVAVSLHSADEDVRQKLMPGVCSVSSVVEFAQHFASRKDGLMIEYTLIKMVNDSASQLQQLLALDWPKNTNFNLIEFNDFGEYKKSPLIHKWKEKIITAGYKCFIRSSRGADIDAACGMLERI